MRAALLAVCAVGCGATTGSAPLVFADQPALTVTTQQGRTLSVFEQVDAPVARGVNAVRMTFPADVALDGETLSVTPWMPVMGHGSAVTPTVQVVDGGFVVTEVSLAMPGQWELRSDFEGGFIDHATISFEIP